MSITLTPTDQNTRDLLKDYTITNGYNDKVLLKIEDNHITAKTVEQLINDPTQPISHRVCYGVLFPWMDHDHLKDTVFIGYSAPPFYNRYKEENNKITVERLEQNTISMEEYTIISKHKIEQNIKHLLDTKKDITLFYSRGIDSLLLLSYLMKYDRVKDTRLIHLGDRISKKPFMDTSIEKQTGFNIETHFVDDEFIYSGFNQSNPFKLRELIFYWVAERFKNSLILCGNEGNSVLFHKWEWVKRIGRPVTMTSCYTKECLNINWNTPTDLDYHTISFIEPRSRSWNSNDLKDIHCPISDMELLRMLPFIDVRNLDTNFIADASMVKNIIRDNVGNKLDFLMTTQTESWNRPVYDETFDTKKIDPIYLKIDALKKENQGNIRRIVRPMGIIHIRNKIQQGLNENRLSFRDIACMKLINYFL